MNAAVEARSPTTYAALVPQRTTTAAPMKGPKNIPIRLTPPRVDNARARSEMGTASVR